MSEGGISLDRARWKRELDEFERRTGLDRVWVLRDVFRQHVNNLVKLTYPKSLKQGKGAVDFDLLQVFVPITESMHISEPITKDGDPFMIATAATGSLYAFKVDRYRPGASTMEMKAEHYPLRDNRGRVHRSRAKYRQNGLTFVEKTHVSQAAFKKYQKMVYKRIGRLKGGWNAAVIKFGGKVGAFVSQHGTSEGSAADTLNQPGNQYLEATNRVPYGSRVLPGIIRFAENQARTILHYRLEKTLERAEKEYNRKKAA